MSDPAGGSLRPKHERPGMALAGGASLILCFMLLGCLPAREAEAPRKESRASPVDGPLGLVPIPAEVERRQGAFRIGASTRVRLEGGADGAERAARFLVEMLRRATGYEIPLSEGAIGEPAPDTIALTHRDAPGDLGTEGYLLEVRDDSVAIRSPGAAGLFYGVQTFRQLLPPEIETTSRGGEVEWTVPAVKIVDRPRFSWRGMHLDVGRHFFPPEEIKRFIDLLALHKLNTFHWHLTEDQGWRLEIRKWPRLVEVGSRRAESPREGSRWEGDGTPYAGHYTQEEVREIVSYARDRFITIVPEIEMPGHCQAAVASYPRLGNRPEPVEVRTRWGVSEHVYNVEEETFRFLEDVLTEVMDLFPGTFVHIGGDEVPKREWRESPSAQARIRAEGLADENELQSWFIRRIEGFLDRRGRRLIGWDEIQEGGLPPKATLMVWRSWRYGVEAVRQGRDIVMSPTSHCYFDYYQGDPRHEPEAIGGMLTLEKVYSFEPVPEELTAEEAGHVLGAQGNLWTEHIGDWDKLAYMAFPRACAMAEVTWSPPERRDFHDFRARWAVHSLRMDRLGVAYRIPPPRPETEAVIFTREGEVAFDAPRGGSVIRYTLDGSAPTPESPLYGGPIPVEGALTVTAAAFRPGGRRSVPVTVEAVRHEPPDPEGLEPGLHVTYHEGAFERVPDMGTLEGGKGILAETFRLGLGEREDDFALHFAGFLRIGRRGRYTFTTGSDDGSVLRLAGARVVENDGLHGHSPRSGTVHLEPGLYPIELGYFERRGTQSLEVLIEGPGLPRQPVPPHLLWRLNPPGGLPKIPGSGG